MGKLCKKGKQKTHGGQYTFVVENDDQKGANLKLFQG